MLTRGFGTFGKGLLPRVREAYSPFMLRRGEIAPDFAFGGRSLYDVLQQYSVTVYFFPKAFTPG